MNGRGDCVETERSKSTWTEIGELLLVRAGKPEEHVSGFPFNFERKAAAWVSA
jgi:hypothetical protein